MVHAREVPPQATSAFVSRLAPTLQFDPDQRDQHHHDAPEAQQLFGRIESSLAPLAAVDADETMSGKETIIMVSGRMSSRGRVA